MADLMVRRFTLGFYQINHQSQSFVANRREHNHNTSASFPAPIFSSRPVTFSNGQMHSQLELMKHARLNVRMPALIQITLAWRLEIERRRTPPV
jgi:hypothetical protein